MSYIYYSLFELLLKESVAYILIGNSWQLDSEAPEHGGPDRDTVIQASLPRVERWSHSTIQGYT